MKREILFRAFDKKMSNPFVMSNPFNPFFYGGLFTGNCVFMQYIGLIDKNSKQIFEDDIVKCEYGTGKVIFKSGCFMVEWLEDKEALLEYVFSRHGIYSRSNDEVFEVIGNIHENPELLGSETE